MEILSKVNSLDEVPSEFRALYKEISEGGETFYLLNAKPVDGYSLDNVVKLKEALQNERAAKVSDVKQAKNDLIEQYGGLTPQKVKDVIEQNKVFSESNSDEKYQEALKQNKKSLEEKYEKIITEINDQVTVLKTQRNEAILDSEVDRVLSEYDYVIDNGAKLVRPHIMSQLEVLEVDNKAVPVVINKKDGQKIPRLSLKQGDSGNMSIAELVEIEANETFSGVFKGSGSSGGIKASTKTETGNNPPQLNGTNEKNEFVPSSTSAGVELLNQARASLKGQDTSI